MADNKARDDSTGNAGPTDKSEDVSMTSIQSTGGEAPTGTAPGNVKNTRRPRMKALLKKLQDQVEFYFSDANISKDRFLKQKMSEHTQGYIPVSLIASFNKMKSLTSDQSLIIEAMDRSPLLKLTPDREYVYRVSPLPLLEEQEVNARTIYVENLPPKADHKRLNSLFSSFGAVTYISLPRHKVSNAIKGFAFIEFSTSEEAGKALEFFQSNDETDKITDDPNINTAADSTAGTDPPVEDNVFTSNKTIAETCSTVSEGEVAGVKDSNVVNRNSTVETLTAGPTNETGLSSSCGPSTASVPLKRKRESIEDEEGQQVTNDSKRPAGNEGTAAGNEGTGVTSTRAAAAGEKEDKKREREIKDEDKPAKRIKTDDTEKEGAPHDGSSCDEGGHSTLNRLNSTVLSEVSVAEEADGEEDGEKKKKKKMRRHRKRRLSTAQYLKTLELKAMSKEKWLEMKALFKQLEKDRMKEFKGHVVKNKDDEKIKGFVSNCLVKIRSIKDDITPDQLKNCCLPFGPVAYIDFKIGDTEGYVRFSTSGCVDQLTKESSVLLDGVTFEAMKEDEEREYFLKTQTARKQHFSKRKRKTTRGHDKLISKALSKSSVVKEDKTPKPSSSHIRFSDSDE